MAAPLPNAITWTPWVVPNGGIDESRSDHELDEKRWKDGLDVEPLPTGCRARNGITKINDLPAPAVAISNATGSDAREFSNGTVDYVSQGITGTATTGLNRLLAVAVRIAKKTGTPTAGVQLAIYDDTAGKPSTAVAGLDFADFNTVAAATINAAAGDYIWIFFTPTNEAFIGNTNLQHIVLKSLGSVGNNYQLAESTAGNPYNPGGTINFGSDGLAWTTVAAGDLLFRVFAGGAPIQGILDYNLSDAATERLLIVAGGQVFKESAGVLVPVSGSEGSLMATGADVHPSMVIAGDIAYISNGIDTPKKFFIRGGIEYWANDGIVAPTATPTGAEAAGGSLPNGDYDIDYYYYDSVLGISSNTRYQGDDSASLQVTTTGANGTINISGLPATVARVGDRATHIRISIKPSASSFFRYSGVQVALGTTTAAITTLTTLGDEPEYDNDPAPLHTMAVVGANQRFISGIKASPYFSGSVDIPWRVMASKLKITGSFYESFPSLNYRDFGRGDGDYNTALAFIAPATLITGLKNSVWALDARRFLTGDPVLISKSVGVAGLHALMVVGRSLFFVSDADKTKGMMFWDGSAVHPLLAIDKTFKTFSASRLKYASCSHLAPGDDRFQWWTLLTESGSSQNVIVVYEYALDAFTIYRISGNILGLAAEGGALAKVKIGGANGFLYDADTGSDDDGEEIVGTFTAKRFDYGMPDAPKRVRFVRAEGDGASNSSLMVQFQPDLQGFPSFSGVLSFDGATGDLLGAGILGTFLLGSSHTIISTRVGLVGICRNAQPNFQSSTRWSLRGYTIGVQATRRR